MKSVRYLTVHYPFCLQSTSNHVDFQTQMSLILHTQSSNLITQQIILLRYMGLRLCWPAGLVGGSYTVSDINRKSIGMKSVYLRGSLRDIMVPFSAQRERKPMSIMEEGYNLVNQFRKLPAS